MVNTFKMAAGSSKRAVTDEIMDSLLLDIEDEIQITLIKNNIEHCERSTNNFDQSEGSSQRSVPVFVAVNVDNNSAVPVHCFVPVPDPVDQITNWGKSLKNLPPFTIKEIEKHRLKCGKTPESAIIKTLDRGRKFKVERYISSDSIFTLLDSDRFHFKCKCKASMKKDL